MGVEVTLQLNVNAVGSVEMVVVVATVAVVMAVGTTVETMT